MKYKILNFFRQLALILLVVWTVVSLVTLLIELVPGDPATTILGETASPEQIAGFNQKHGLDRPAFFFTYNGTRGFVWNGADNRYVDYWVGLLQGDLGTSFRTERPVLDMILERYPSTIMLAVVSMIIAVCIAVPLGVLAGTNKGTLIDNASSFIALWEFLCRHSSSDRF
jgi:peptide/nickel transport system permease protein